MTMRAPVSLSLSFSFSWLLWTWTQEHVQYSVSCEDGGSVEGCVGRVSEENTEEFYWWILFPEKILQCFLLFTFSSWESLLEELLLTWMLVWPQDTSLAPCTETWWKAQFPHSLTLVQSLLSWPVHLPAHSLVLVYCFTLISFGTTFEWRWCLSFIMTCHTFNECFKNKQFLFLRELAKIPSNAVFQIPASTECPEGEPLFGGLLGQVWVGATTYSRFTFPRHPELPGHWLRVAIPSSHQWVPGASLWLPTAVCLFDISGFWVPWLPCVINGSLVWRTFYASKTHFR